MHRTSIPACKACGAAASWIGVWETPTCQRSFGRKPVRNCRTSESTARPIQQKTKEKKECKRSGPGCKKKTLKLKKKILNECKNSKFKPKNSLLYPCFKTALCYGVVSGCFVHGVSPSSRFRPELAPKRGLGGSGLAFRTPESPRKVHAKSFGPECGLAG